MHQNNTEQTLICINNKSHVRKTTSLSVKHKQNHCYYMKNELYNTFKITTIFSRGKKK